MACLLPDSFTSVRACLMPDLRLCSADAHRILIVFDSRIP